MRQRLLPLLFALSAFGPATAWGEEALPRVASLNLCADELVLRLADRAQIASVTSLARDGQLSNVSALAAEVPINDGAAEEIALQAPDLVLTGAFTTQGASGFLRRIGTPILELSMPQTLDGTYDQIIEIATALGQRERGAAIIGNMHATLDTSAATGERPRALVLEPNGFTVGPGSLSDELLARAGLSNAATELGIAAYGHVPLETIVLSAPDILVVDADDDAPSLATEILRHPALARLEGRTQIVAVPSRLWTCPGPGLVEAVQRLRDGAARWRDAKGDAGGGS
ncbi:ABC transporter substrate-binding protein [Aureimonas mangrovi]|uniref:ABC transporter substrate-binding protein n=1 Tax=Aureimonas mangrovi TaxID=2758041 RepID=UPI00163DD6FC|nr:ABC transporter substrate-binding protein [Aureimonas mangrovi]